MLTITNDLRLFKKMVKVIINSKKEMEDSDRYVKCVSLIWDLDWSDMLKNKCKDYVIEQLEQKNERTALC